ncbi:hypothetical protein EBR66_04180 [bacterium]|nr:hypothetical protein [bacterium]
MNKVTVGVLVLLLAGALWFTLGSKKVEAPVETATTATTTTSTTPDIQVTQTPKGAVPKPPSYQSVITQKGSHQCNYEQVSQTSRSGHVLYIADGKMRGEFRTTTAAGATVTLVVYDGRYLYTWTEGKTAGSRTQPSSVSELPSIIPKDFTSGTILGTGSNNVGWSCHTWIKDAKLLTPPSYISFK